MNKPHAIGLGALTAVSVFGCALAYQFVHSTDTLTRIVDGDTLVINGTTHVRLWGIDAPELEQTCIRDNNSLKVAWHCGKVSRDYLKSFFMPNVQLKCEPRGDKSYGRSVAICYSINLKGERHDIARSLVAAGYAVDWPQYSHGYYAGEQDYAKRHRLGIWSGTFEMPWDWRKAKR